MNRFTLVRMTATEANVNRVTDALMEPHPNEPCSICGSAYGAHGFISHVCPHVNDFFKPYSLNAKLKASNILADIEQAQADLATMRAYETEMRQILVWDLDSLQINAERAKYKIAAGQWNVIEDGNLKVHVDSTYEAMRIHAHALAEIAGKVAYLAELQKDLDAITGGAA